LVVGRDSLLVGGRSGAFSRRKHFGLVQQDQVRSSFYFKRLNVLQQDHVRLDLNLPLMIEFQNLKSLVIFVYLQVVYLFILPFKC
jgi:hypothetical protein